MQFIFYASSEMALDAVNYLESDASPIKDYTDFGMVCGSLGEDIARDIYRAAEGKGVMRGTINFPDEMDAEQAVMIYRILAGEGCSVFDAVKNVPVTIDNVANFYTFDD